MVGIVGAGAPVLTQAAAAAPPAVAAYEARNTAAVGATQTESAVQASANTNRNQENREVRQETRERSAPPKTASVGPRGKNVDIEV